MDVPASLQNRCDVYVCVGGVSFIHSALKCTYVRTPCAINLGASAGATQMGFNTPFFFSFFFGFNPPPSALLAFLFCREEAGFG